jgi:hypothetical protein
MSNKENVDAVDTKYSRILKKLEQCNCSQELLDETLYDVMRDDSPNRELIKKLIENGANINAKRVIIDIIDFYPHERVNQEFYEYYLEAGCIEYFEPINANYDLLEYIRFLMENGADIHQKEEGVNAILYNLIRLDSKNKEEIFEFFLKAGVDPNGIIEETVYDDLGMTIMDMLDLADPDLDNDPDYAHTQLWCARLIEKYGGKETEEHYETDIINEYLRIGTKYRTGIISDKGNIEPEKIPNITPELIEEFKLWLKKEPKGNDFIQEIVDPFYVEGIIIAKKIKALVGDKVEIDLVNFNWEQQDYEWLDIHNLYDNDNTWGYSFSSFYIKSQLKKANDFLYGECPLNDVATNDIWDPRLK